MAGSKPVHQMLERRHYLRRGNLRTGEIAYLLEYDETNSFYRVFRSWTGTTPETLPAAIAS